MPAYFLEFLLVMTLTKQGIHGNVLPFPVIVCLNALFYVVMVRLVLGRKRSGTRNL